MTILDFSILALIGISFLIGLVRGFVREALSLFTWGLSLWLAFTYAGHFPQYFERFISDSTLQLIASFFAVLIVCLIAFSIIGHIISSLFESTGLTGIDRTLGGAFGLLRGAVIVAVLVLLAGLTGFTNEAWWQESVLVEYFKPLAKFIHELIPDNLTEYLGQS